MTDDPEITDPRDPYKKRRDKVSAGPYALEIPPNGVAILYETDEAGVEHQLAGGVGYFEALIQFAGEVIRLNAEIAALRERCAASDVDILIEVGRNEALEAAARLCPSAR